MGFLKIWISAMLVTCVLATEQMSQTRCISNAECSTSLTLDQEHGREFSFHLSDISGERDTFNAWEAASLDIGYQSLEKNVNFFIQPIVMPPSGSFEVLRVCLNVKNVQKILLVMKNSHVEPGDYRYQREYEIAVSDKDGQHVCYARKFFATALIIEVTKYNLKDLMSVKHLRVVACGDNAEDSSLQKNPPEQRPIGAEGPGCVHQHLVTSAEDAALTISVNGKASDASPALMTSGRQYTGSTGNLVVFHITPAGKPKFGWVGLCLEVQNANSVDLKIQSLGQITEKKLTMCDHTVWTRFCTGPPKVDYLVVEKLTVVIYPYKGIKDLAVGVKGMHIKTCWDFLKQR